MQEDHNSAPVIISLDQVAISFMEPKGQVAPAWPKIKSSLIAGVDAGRLVCPTPHETVWESTPLLEDRYGRFRKLQSHLSRGFSFKSFSRLLCEEVLALIRPEMSITPWEPGNWDSLRDRLVGSASRDGFLKLKHSVEAQCRSTGQFAFH